MILNLLNQIGINYKSLTIYKNINKEVLLLNHFTQSKININLDQEIKKNKSKHYQWDTIMFQDILKDLNKKIILIVNANMI